MATAAQVVFACEAITQRRAKKGMEYGEGNHAADFVWRIPMPRAVLARRIFRTGRTSFVIGLIVLLAILREKRWFLDGILFLHTTARRYRRILKKISLPVTGVIHSNECFASGKNQMFKLQQVGLGSRLLVKIIQNLL